MTDRHTVLDFAHAHNEDARNAGRVLTAAILTGLFMVAEVIGGVISGSLALIADAAHMLTDSVALALAWMAFRLSRRPPDPRRTYGFDRVQILVAFANGLTLILIVVWIAVEAVQRLIDPPQVLGVTMLSVAAAGLVVNIAAFFILHGGDQKNLNMRGATLHVMGDLLGSIAALVAAAVILTTGWMPIDPLLSVFVAGLIGVNAVRLVRDSAHILLEGAPANLNVTEIAADLTAEIPAVIDIHHVHIWSLNQRSVMATLHALVAEDADPHAVIWAVTDRLRSRFDIKHATVQVEVGACIDLATSPIGHEGPSTP